MKWTEAKKVILDCYQEFHDPVYLVWDPLIVVRRYHSSRDEEWIAWLSALMAYGGVKQIIKSLDTILDRLSVGGGRRDFVDVLISEKDEIKLGAELLEHLKGFAHRFYIDRDVVMVLLLYRRSWLEYGSLENHFLKFHKAEDETIEAGLIGLVDEYKVWSKQIPFQAGPHFNHMLNSPAQKSVCKRWVMFLKWMVRPDDGIDLGLWKKVRPDQLVIPLDTHLFKISKKLKLTKKKTPSWGAALEVSKNLKKLDPTDPIKYDFSLCRLGMFNNQTD